MTRRARYAFTFAKSSASNGFPLRVTTSRGGESSRAFATKSSMVSLSMSAKRTTGLSKVPARSLFATAICFKRGTNCEFQFTTTVWSVSMTLLFPVFTSSTLVAISSEIMPMITANTKNPVKTIVCVTIPLQRLLSVVASAPGMSNRLKYAFFRLSLKEPSSSPSASSPSESEAPPPPSASTTLYATAPTNTIGTVKMNKQSTLPISGNAKTFWTLYVKISVGVYSLYSVKCEFSEFWFFLTGSAFSFFETPVSFDEISPTSEVPAFACDGACGVPTGNSDATASNNDAPKTLAENVLPRRFGEDVDVDSISVLGDISTMSASSRSASFDFGRWGTAAVSPSSPATPEPPPRKARHTQVNTLVRRCPATRVLAEGVWSTPPE
mmetsp:Transcript_11913/g.39591  ORF Transcript_11913/g.39591 Transcript_11913/m.39591 type:complete len:382 (+) Transcript_11913:2447-3592(+)